MSSKMERVVVTGMGIASPLGCSVPEFWENLLAGRSGIGSLDGGIFSGLFTRIGGEVWGQRSKTYGSLLPIGNGCRAAGGLRGKV
jgi:3-oxoacyl-[acyl-carrier-protein] synthase II